MLALVWGVWDVLRGVVFRQRRGCDVSPGPAVSAACLQTTAWVVVVLHRGCQLSVGVAGLFGGAGVLLGGAPCYDPRGIRCSRGMVTTWTGRGKSTRASISLTLAGNIGTGGMLLYGVGVFSMGWPVYQRLSTMTGSQT